jgi:hypothetical protein
VTAKRAKPLAFAFAFALTMPSAWANEGVTIERATVPWSELERLLRREGAPPPPRAAPRAYAVPSLEVTGEIDSPRAQLAITLDVEILADRWTLAPLLPARLSVARATVNSPEGRRGLLVRDPGGVSLAADGPGRYHIELEAEGTLDHGRLAVAPPGLSGGRTRLIVRGADSIAGRTAFRTSPGPDGALVAEAALGPYGLDLQLAGAPPTASEAGTTVEDLEAITVLSLGGGGVTRLLFQAGAEDGFLELALPPGARLWRVYAAGAALPVTSVAHGETIRLPLKKPSRIELAFTFEAPPLGIRGRYHLELPRLPVPVRGARWQVWLPSGLRYGAPQAAMSTARCDGAPPGSARPRTPIAPVGSCFGFERPVLEPGRAYVEGTYDQPF